MSVYKDLYKSRKSYEKYQLLESSICSCPFEQFHRWYSEAEQNNTGEEINVMTLSTVNSEGQPSARIVLLKYYDLEGFVFFTNYASHKGQDIAHNPKVCLNFFWAMSERQVIIRGVSSKTTERVSDEYFYSRPLKSQIGAMVSQQSKEIHSRDVLDEEFKSFEALNTTPIRPKEWGGVQVTPTEIEFWQGRENRLHDRLVYKRKEGDSWSTHRLSP